MPRRFFISATPVDGGVALDGGVADHIGRSLRMRPGDIVVVVDPQGREHGVRLTDVVPGRVTAETLWSRDATGEPRLRMSVLQALPSERMEDCIDALVEVGAASIHPVITEHVVSRPAADRHPRRLERWRSVATEAAQLAGRGWVPQVTEPVDLPTALAGLPPGCRVIACTFDGSVALARLEVDPDRPLALCVGPEGGLGDRDLTVLAGAGAETAHLGGRVLRTRYAGAIACALLLGRSGDLDQAMGAEPAW